MFNFKHILSKVTSDSSETLFILSVSFLYNFNHETIIILENNCVKTLFFENTLVFSVQVFVLRAQINHESFETFIK